MKKFQIKIGGVYLAKTSVNSPLYKVRVDKIIDGCPTPLGKRTETLYHVTVLGADKKLVFHSAARFRKEVKEAGQSADRPTLSPSSKPPTTSTSVSTTKCSTASSVPVTTSVPPTTSMRSTTTPSIPTSSTVPSTDLGAKLRQAREPRQPTDNAPHLIVEALAGCLTADTVINFNRAGRGGKMMIESVVKKFNGLAATSLRSDIGREVRTRPWDLSIPTRIARAVGDVVMLGTLKRAWCSGEKMVFMLTTRSGRSIRATAEHPFLTEQGEWKPLCDLKIGEGLLVNCGRPKGQSPSGGKKQSQWTSTMFHPWQVGKAKGYFGVATHRLVVEAVRNNLPFHDYVYYLRFDKIRCKTFTYLSPEQIVHHKNENPMDNRVANLEVLESTKEHCDRHNWGNNVLFRIGPEKIASIKRGSIEVTYDLEMESEPHNFLANGFVVHNTGKTSTIVEGLKIVKGIPSSLTPSPQQAKVWEAMAASQDAQSICFCAFNKSIADTLKARVPAGCDASTMHSMGFKAVQRAFGGKVQVDQYRVDEIVGELIGWDAYDVRRQRPELLSGCKELVAMCKMNLIDPSDTEALMDIADYYEIEMGRYANQVFELTPRITARCQDVDKDGTVDFNDMIWLPVEMKLSVYKYDLLLGDEIQDWNRCQQSLAKMAGHRLILVGDRNQSVYGFAGADSEGMPRLLSELEATERGCIHLPLTVTYRCAKAIVREAQAIVPQFSYFETNPEGSIGHAAFKSRNGSTAETYHRLVGSGDMVLCRVNAPLVSECLKFIRDGKKANIQGRDVGGSLIKTVLKSLGVKDRKLLVNYKIEELVIALDDWEAEALSKERAKRRPNNNKLVNIQDRRDCLDCFCEQAKTAEDVVRKIESVFTDDKSSPGIMLSSVHRAKGLEAQRVFLLEPEGATIPHPMAKAEWEIRGEWCIRYVALTRAINELVYVK